MRVIRPNDEPICRPGRTLSRNIPSFDRAGRVRHLPRREDYAPAFFDDVPYNVALVELEEGTRLHSTIRDCPNDELSMGMPVEVVFDRVTDEITLPRFRPRR